MTTHESYNPGYPTENTALNSRPAGEDPPELVGQKTRQLVSVFSGTPRFILNAGCAIPADTPPENLRAMLRAARPTLASP
jgi:hypothetical protein